MAGDGRYQSVGRLYVRKAHLTAVVLDAVATSVVPEDSAEAAGDSEQDGHPGEQDRHHGGTGAERSAAHPGPFALSSFVTRA